MRSFYIWFKKQSWTLQNIHVRWKILEPFKSCEYCYINRVLSSADRAAVPPVCSKKSSLTRPTFNDRLPAIIINIITINITPHSLGSCTYFADIAMGHGPPILCQLMLFQYTEQGVRERAWVPQLVMLCRWWAHLQCFAGRTSRLQAIENAHITATPGLFRKI